MKTIKTILALCCIFFAYELHAQVNVMSFNIRLDLASDSMNAWPFRKDKVCAQIIYENAQLIGVQEALHHQLLDMLAGLPGYAYIGVGREDGKNKGEASAIVYDTSRFRVLEGSTFWLSETPGIPGSKGWDAAFPRVVTWAKFYDKKEKKVFFHFNTHFDHMGEIARRQSAAMLLHAVDSIAGKMKAIVTGDFNATPDDEPMQIILRAKGFHLTDSKLVSIQPHYGPTGTFNGFESKERDDFPIDYIMFNHDVKVLRHASLSESWKGRFSSDHFPVLATLKL
jgi:endonuclease/exonuclease/phosphatase family metal-dependent hydrolase